MNEYTLRVRVVASLGEFKAQMGAAGAEVKAFGNTVATSTGKTAAGFQQMGRASVVAGALVVAGFAASVGAAADFETAMRNVNTIAGMTESQFASTGDALVQMSTRLPQSATSLAQGLYDIASSGFKGAEGMEVLDASATAASAGLSTTATAAKAITAVLNAYGRSASDSTDISDTLFQTVNLGVISFEELASGVGDWIGTAQAANVSFEEASAGLAAMTLSGISAAESGTSLNRVLLSFVKPSEGMADALAAIGYQSGVAALEALGLKGTMEALAAAGYEDVESLSALFPEVRGLRGAFALLANEGKNFETTSAGITDAAKRQGAAQAALEEQSKALGFQLTLMKNSIMAVAIEIGTALIPVVKAIAGFITTLVQGFSALPGPVKTVATVLGLVAGATMLFSGATMLAIPKIAAFREGFTNLANTAPKAAAGLKAGGVALGLVSVALVAGSMVMAAYAKDQAAATARKEKWLEVLQSETDELEKNTNAHLAKLIAEGDLRSKASEAGVSIETVKSALSGEASAIREIIDLRKKMGVELMNGTRQYDGTVRALDDLVVAVKDEGVAAGDAAEESARLTAEQERLKYSGIGSADAFERNTDAAKGLSKAMQDVNDAALTKAIDAYTDSLDDLYGSAFTVEDAVERISSGVIDFAQALVDAKHGGDQFATSLDATNASGLQNRSTLKGIVRDALDAADAMNRQGIDPRPAMNALHTQLVDQLTALGMNRTAVLELTDALLHVPSPTIRLTLETQQAINDLNRYIDELRKVPAALVTRLGITIDVATGIAQAESADAHRFRNQAGIQARTTATSRGSAIGSALGNAIGTGASGLRPSGGGGGGGKSDAEKAADEAEQARKDWIAAEDEFNRNLYDHNMQSLNDYMAYLDKRLAMEKKGSAEYFALLDEQQRVRDEYAADVKLWNDTLAENEAERIAKVQEAEDIQFREGRLSVAEYKQILMDRHADMVEAHGYWSSEAESIRDELRRIDKEILDNAKKAAEEAAKIRKELIEKLSKARDDAFDKLNDYLDDAKSIRKKMVDAETAHNEKLAAIGRKYNEDQQEILDDRRDQLAGWADVSQRVTVGWGNTVSALARNVADQMGIFDEWVDSLDAARARGVSEAVIDLLGLDEGPEALGQLRMFATATQQEINALNAAVEARAKQAGDQVAKEQGESYSAVGKLLSDLARKHHDEIQKLTDEFLAAQYELKTELATLGMDQGRSYADAIAQGLMSGIPGIVAAALAAQQALAAVNAAETGTAGQKPHNAKPLPPGGKTPKPASGYVLPGTPIASGSKALWQNSKGVFVSSYDDGGYLPVGWTMAYNGTGRPEPVGHDLRGSVSVNPLFTVQVFDANGHLVTDERLRVVVREENRAHAGQRTVVGAR